jgi:arabinogalactan oligomer / maltooligosaccharide transport system permease protein
VSTTTARAQPPPRPGFLAAAMSLPTRLIVLFSGTVGLVLKLLFLGVVNGVAVWAGTILAGDDAWIALAILVAATLAIDAVYLLPRRTLPAKFLVPGTIFLLGFQIIPIVYTVNVAFTNYSTGHILSKPEAIEGIKVNSLTPPPDGKTYTMAPARDGNGKLVLLLADDDSGETFVGTPKGLAPLRRASVHFDDGLITGAEGYTVIKGAELFRLDRELTAYIVPTRGDSAIRPEGIESALELRPTLSYDARSDTFTRTSDGLVFRDNRKGAFVAESGQELEPGWKAGIGVENFRRVVEDPLIRDPFLRVFVWTFAFAFITVLFSFALGLFLAISLDKPRMRFQRTYRSLLVIPWAIPGFLSILVWGGLLNDDFGVVNRLFHTSIPWLFDANWAKGSVLIVSLWLTFPYFFLVSLGALQSIPAELTEAARVDGAGPWQLFRKVTLPLLLVAVAPLLIASFAFNFNNFNNIYLLTGGGPATGEQSVAGATDILISYTYKLAFEAGKGNDYGLAASVSILIFFIVALISGVSFWRSKSLETMR